MGSPVLATFNIDAGRRLTLQALEISDRAVHFLVDQPVGLVQAWS